MQELIKQQKEGISLNFEGVTTPFHEEGARVQSKKLILEYIASRTKVSDEITSKVQSIYHLDKLDALYVELLHTKDATTIESVVAKHAAN